MLKEIQELKGKGVKHLTLREQWCEDREILNTDKETKLFENLYAKVTENKEVRDILAEPDNYLLCFTLGDKIVAEIDAVDGHKYIEMTLN